MPPPPAPGVRRLAWVPLVVGVGLAGGATAGFLVANDAAGKIPSSTEPVALQLARDGQLAQTLGWVAVGGSAAALLTAGAFVLFGAPSGAPPPVTVTLSPAGVGLSFSGGF